MAYNNSSGVQIFKYTIMSIENLLVVWVLSIYVLYVHCINMTMHKQTDAQVVK